MKKRFYLLLLILLYFSKTYAQNHEMFGTTKFHEMIVPTFVSENIAGSQQVLAEAKLKFTVLKIESNGDYLIQFWQWKNTTDAKILAKASLYNYKDVTKKSNGIISGQLDNLKIFKLSAEDFKNNTIPYYNAGFHRGAFDWSSGLVILPIKTRTKPNFTYSKDFSLGLSGGGKIRISHRNPTYLNLLVNVGISSISIDSLSSNGKLKQPSDRAAFTTAIGLVLENHSFQFGIFYGKDRLSANDFRNTSWIYNDKTWFSVGLGYQILSASDKNKNSKPANQPAK